MSRTVHVGIDPGVGAGCVAVLFPPGTSPAVQTVRVSDVTLRDLWDYLSSLRERWPDIRAVIERQTAGAFEHTSKSSSAKLYGSYRELRALLVAAGIPFEEKMAGTWQKALGAPTRVQSRTYHDHKKRLREMAQSIFPQERVAADDADALLIAEYCRRTGGAG